MSARLPGTCTATPDCDDPQLLARILARADVVDTGYVTPCWISNRAHQRNGYTRISVDGVVWFTHRFALHLTLGPLDPLLVTDHLCRQRDCARPSHLEMVTPRENSLRGETFAAEQVARTHCPYGHPFDEINTKRQASTPSQRRCRECDRIRKAQPWTCEDCRVTIRRGNREAHRRTVHEGRPRARTRNMHRHAGL